MHKEPTTLQQAIIYFADADNCREYVVARRWPDGVICPRCESRGASFSAKYSRWQCNKHHDKRQFTVKTGTIFEDSPLGLDKWLVAMWLMVNCKNGVSSYEIERAIGVTQKTAWFMDHRIRLALQMGSQEKMSGEVEVDETFIGGKARNMHADKRRQKIHGRGTVGKAVVMGLLERHGEVRTKVVADTKRKTLKPHILENVEPGAELFSDALKSYEGLDPEYVHQVIDHAECYVNGKIHTNSLENFWSLVKRCIGGTYVSVEPFHLFRYLDEEAFRFNKRKMTDAERFSVAVSGIVGKRVTYASVTGNDGESEFHLGNNAASAINA